MRRYSHSKSGLFLMELLLNLLLFCILCGCGLLFFIKSYNLTQDTTTLHQAVRITSSVAAIYESGDGSLTNIGRQYERPVIGEDSICIYFDETYEPCIKEAAQYYLLAHLVENLDESLSAAGLCKLDIRFYDMEDREIYSIIACNHNPSTPKEAGATAVVPWTGREVAP